MTIDLHIHSKNSDGSLSVKKIFEIAKHKNISLLSITDHDSIKCQDEATRLAKQTGIRYISGVELNVTFKNSRFPKKKPITMDFLGYNFDMENSQIQKKLEIMAQHRQKRAMKILEKLNAEFKKNQIKELIQEDMIKIQKSIDGVIGRPHIADYLVKKGIVQDRNEAFSKYLVKCNVPKYPFSPIDATRLVRNAGGKIVLAHPNDPRGTSLTELTKSLGEQTEIITNELLQFIDGIESWHSRSDVITTNHYVKYSKEHGLLMTGGSDCHQKPIIMGTINIPSYIANQFQ